MIVRHCCKMCFLDSWWCWTSLQMLICHPSILFSTMFMLPVFYLDFVFSCWAFETSLYIQDVSPLSYMWCANIFSWFLDCFIFLFSSFYSQSLLQRKKNFKVGLIISCFVSWLFCFIIFCFLIFVCCWVSWPHF